MSGYEELKQLDVSEAAEAMDAALAAAEPVSVPDTLPCGHPPTAVVSADEGTSFCGACNPAERERER